MSDISLEIISTDFLGIADFNPYIPRICDVLLNRHFKVF